VPTTGSSESGDADDDESTGADSSGSSGGGSSSSGEGDSSTTGASESESESSSSSTGTDVPGAPGGTIIPLYTYPTDPTWATVASLQTSYPEVDIIAIINPASGPGMAFDANYDAGIDMLQTAGVTVVGYVSTSYGTRPLADAQYDVALYADYYDQLDGIMFDEMSTVAEDAVYYEALEHTAAVEFLDVTIGNPGTTVPEELLGIFDTILIYEAVGLPDPDTLGIPGHAPEEFAVIPHGVPVLDGAFIPAALEHVQFIYITDYTLPNPWDSLPSYFDELVGALAEG
jgi:hypothetical protein